MPVDYSTLLSFFSNQIKSISFKQLNVLSAGWEGGSVKLIGLQKGEEKIVHISKAGGMSVVVAELPQALIRYGKEAGIKFFVNSVCPYVGGAMRDTSLSSLVSEGYVRKVKDFNASYGEKVFPVEIYEGKTEFGKQFLIKSDAWGGKFGGNMSPYILTLTGQEELKKMERDFVPNTPCAINLAEERAYIVFAQAVAKLYEYTASYAAILHDYHAGLAAFYNDKINPVLIGHNMAYQGVMAINKNLLVSKNMKLNHMAALRDLSFRLCLNKETVHKYFRSWVRYDDVGTGNILQAVIKKCREKTGISATTVSEGYASELHENYDSLKARISSLAMKPLSEDYFSIEKTRMRIKDFYRTHFGIEILNEEADRFQLMEESRGLDELKSANIVGILNGMDIEKHASRNKLLKEIVINPYSFKWHNIEAPAYLKNVVAVDPDFKDGLNYDAAQPQRVFKAKSILRKILLMEFFPQPEYRELWDDKRSFIHYSWGRLVDQKNIPLILSEAEQITRKGNILIVVAVNPDDSLSFKIKDLAEEKAKHMQENGHRFAFSSEFDTRGAILAGGADLVHIPSRYEPCGLTDMESYWMGTPVVANLVGGLGKGGYAVGNFVADPTSLESMRIAYRRVYHRACNIKKYYPDKWKELCLEALSLDFSYKMPANKYIDMIYLAYTKET
ncbi:MAG: glycogen/starch synthase, partial [archaeon]